MKGSRIGIIVGIIAAAVAVGVVLALTQTQKEEEPVSNFPIKIDFARVLPYENATSYPNVTRGYAMHIRLLYPQEGPPRPFYLLLAKQGESWDQLTTPEEWVKQKNHGFEVLSSSKQFDLFTEYYPFDSTLLPFQMRLYCASCNETLSKPEIIWHAADTKITKIKGLFVSEGEERYSIGFALGNNQIDTLPASGFVEFVLTDSIGVSLFETRFNVKDTDFRPANDPIQFLRIPMGGKASYGFSIPAEQIKPSPSGKTTGIAFLSFVFEDGRAISTGTKDVKLPLI
ncbi:MAG: hypothetical protein ACRD5H_04650 [Nitrososphaerales archaeon]